eukprot:g43684.t1
MLTLNSTRLLRPVMNILSKKIITVPPAWDGKVDPVLTCLGNHKPLAFCTGSCSRRTLMTDLLAGAKTHSEVAIALRRYETSADLA